jgi:ABC-type bacteriocin/lantibiotic exporter with double-glycine peptidase domain
MISGSLVNLRFSRDAVSRLYHDLEQLQSGDVHDTRSEEYELNMIKNNTNWKLEDLDVESEKASCDFTTAQSQYETFRLLEMRNLSFCYTNVLVDALQGINLQIRSGDSVGIIGTSGAGKTTLIDMFLGLHEPQTGSITFNGRPLREALLDWRSQTAYLPQQVFLIDNTLKRNVALGVEDVNIDETRLHEALRKARLSELLKQLPNGVETLLGERGVRLSGGQRQRVALARAFYHARGVLVMDEATNALDDSTEREIVEEIKHLKGKITMIVIAHRLTTVQHCDRIYRLENGCMVEEGHTKHVLRQAV